MWKRIFKPTTAPRPAPAAVVSALVDVNLLQLHLAEAKALLSDDAHYSPSLHAVMQDFESSASRLLDDLPEMSAEPEDWHAVLRRTRLLNASFEGARLVWRRPVAA